MIDDLFDGLTIYNCHDDVHRNIVSLRESQDLFDDLTDSPDAMQAAIELEMASKPHTYSNHQPIIDRPFEEASYNEAIGYPFTHWARTRYSDGSFGVWYGADSIDTSVHETVYHWKQGLLADAGWQDIDDVVVERKVYLVRCDTALLDFRTKLPQFPALIDPASYQFTHQAGARIHHDGHPGLISRSARCEGDVYAVFNAQVLSNPRQQCYLTYRTERGKVLIEREQGKVMLEI